MKHTQGPWTTVFGTSITTSIGGSIADCVGRHDYETQKANAYLMSAAPDMLAALEALLNVTTDYDTVHALAVAAVAKARGALNG